MNTLKTLIGMSGLIIALGGWSVANAATYTFNFAVSNNANSSLSFTGKKTSGNGADTLKVTASGKTGSDTSATLQSWAGNGLGVTNTVDKKWGKNIDEHYVDNQGSDDFVLFDFGQQKVKVTKIVLQAWGDTDITVNSGSVWSNNRRDFENGTLVKDIKGNPVLANGQKLYEFDVSNLTVSNSNLWRIFAQRGEENDKFKINSMTVVSTVPLPAAVWLFGSALLGMVGIGYRRQTRQI
jgi:hypothetical protein